MKITKANPGKSTPFCEVLVGCLFEHKNQLHIKTGVDDSLIVGTHKTKCFVLTPNTPVAVVSELTYTVEV